MYNGIKFKFILYSNYSSIFEYDAYIFLLYTPATLQLFK